MIFRIAALFAVCQAAQYDAVYEMEMAKAKMAYLNRKKMVNTGATWEDIQKMNFHGVEIDSYAPLAHFFLNLYGENFDLHLALHSCQPQQQDMWSKILGKNCQGMMSPPLLHEFCEIFANYLEQERMMAGDSISINCQTNFGMPINQKNCDPYTYYNYLNVGDQLARQLIARDKAKFQKCNPATARVPARPKP